MSTKKLPKSILAWAAANPDKFDEGWTERDGDLWSHWVYLNPGWFNPAMGCHTVHEWTAREVLQQLKEIEPCACAECRSATEHRPFVAAPSDFTADEIRDEIAHDLAWARKRA